MKLDRTSYFRVFGALSAALLIANQSHAQPAVYPAVTAEQVEHPDASDQAERGEREQASLQSADYLSGF